MAGELQSQGQLIEMLSQNLKVKRGLEYNSVVENLPGKQKGSKILGSNPGSASRNVKPKRCLILSVASGITLFEDAFFLQGQD